MRIDLDELIECKQCGAIIIPHYEKEGGDNTPIRETGTYICPVCKTEHYDFNKKR